VQYIFAYIAISTFLSGDMTIGEGYEGVEGVPTQNESGSLVVVFKGIEITFKSVCIVTRDQLPIPSSPTCFYEFQLFYCASDGKCRKGRFTAHGSGPENLSITGGTNDFFGAWGQIKTPNPFTFTFNAIDPVTGDLVTSSIDMIIELCFYE